MAAIVHGVGLEEQIGLWRSFLSRRQAIRSTDVEELEGHLRDQISALVERGLDEEEAFLVAVKRMGNLDAISREFAREHSDRLWKQLVLTPSAEADASSDRGRELLVAIALAISAAVAIKLPALFGIDIEGNEPFYARNASFFVLPFVIGFFAWKRQLDARLVAWLGAVLILACVVANGFPFQANSDTEALLALHLPIALWLAVGISYTGGQWNVPSARMNFVRFSGELFIYYVLIALGGGVLMAFTFAMFNAIGLDVELLAQNWLVPCGAVGGVIVASWLVEAKQSVIENMAPVLTRIFTPLFTLVLLAFLGTMLWTGRGVDIQREVLIGFDLLLVVVAGLLLYAISARDPQAPPGAFDALLLLLVVSALIVDAVALAAIGSRISEFGFTPNRVAALGENLILLANLAWSAVLYVRFMRRRGPFVALERWQMAYLPVYAAWAAIVVIFFPIAFGFA